MRAATKEAYSLFQRGAVALARAEAAGIRVDVGYLEQAIKDVDEKIKDCAKQIEGDAVYRLWRREYGSDLNLTSRQQLGHILHDVLEVPYEHKYRNKDGSYKVDKESFDNIDHPFIKLYVRHEGLKKVKTTYLEGIYREVVDGYLHSMYHLNLARSYRSSSSKPNWQNMPIRNKEFAEIVRRCFIPRKGHVFVGRDFKGIEVCIGCCYHKDPALIAYVKDKKKDMHRDSAMEIYLLKKEEVSKETRYAAKNRFVFPEFYGSYYKQCAKHLWDSIPQLELKVATDGFPLRDHLADKGILELGALDDNEKPEEGTFEHLVYKAERSMWDRFKVYEQWKRDVWEEYCRKGSFSLLTGFVVNEGVCSKRQVANIPIQGSAFHCQLHTFTELDDWMEQERTESVLVGQIHDSIDGDIHESEVEDYISVGNEIIAELPKVWTWINVPLEVETEIASVSWFDKETYEEAA